MQYLRIFTGPDGHSHLQTVAVTPPLRITPLQAPEELSEAVFGEVAARSSAPRWATVPRPQLMVSLTGRFDLRTSDGSSQRIIPGTVILAEDTTGQGHLVTNCNSQCQVVTLPFAIDQNLPLKERIAATYSHFNLQNVDDVYEELKRVIDIQSKTIDNVRVTATWFITAAGAIAIGAASRASDINMMNPTGFTKFGLIVGVLAVVVSGVITLYATSIGNYERIDYTRLIQEYPEWNPDYAKMYWMNTWRRILGRNDEIIRVRYWALQVGYVLIVAGLLAFGTAVLYLFGYWMWSPVAVVVGVMVFIVLQTMARRRVRGVV